MTKEIDELMQPSEGEQFLRDIIEHVKEQTLKNHMPSADKDFVSKKAHEMGDVPEMMLVVLVGLLIQYLMVASEKRVIARLTPQINELIKTAKDGRKEE